MVARTFQLVDMEDDDCQQQATGPPQSDPAGQTTAIDGPLHDLCKHVLDQLGLDYRERLAEIALAARQACLSEDMLGEAFEATCRKLAEKSLYTYSEVKLFLHPIQLTVRLRLKP